MQKGSTSTEVLASVSLYFASVQWVQGWLGNQRCAQGHGTQRKRWETRKGHVPAFLEDCSLKEVGGISGDTRKNTAEQISGRNSLCASKNNSIHHPGACGDMGLGRQRKGLEPGKQAALHQGHLWPVGPPGGFSNSMGLGPSRAEESWAVPSLDIPGDHLGGRGQEERATTPPELPLLLSQEAARCTPESLQIKVNFGSTVNRFPKAMVKGLLAVQSSLASGP